MSDVLTTPTMLQRLVRDLRSNLETADHALAKAYDRAGAGAASPIDLLYVNDPVSHESATVEGGDITVVPVAGEELGRGRGGPRCMTCPIERDAVSSAVRA